MVSYLPSGIEPLTQGLGVLGQALGRSYKEKKQRSALGNILEDLNLSTFQGRQAAVQQSLQKGIPEDLIKSALGNLPPPGLHAPSLGDMQSLFKMSGVPDETASQLINVYGGLSVGGKTQMAKLLVDQLQRSGSLSGQPPDQQQQGPANQFGDQQPEKPGFQFPEIDLFKGLTPGEKVSRQNDLQKENDKQFIEIRDDRQRLQKEKISYDQLERLNNKGTLPSGPGRWNVQIKSGKLRIPAAANADAQLFVKIINDFTTQAKDSYGARVTNFELDAFMQRLPTLANTEEGRRLIINEMKRINELNSLHADSKYDVYKHYGSRGIDIVGAETIAEQKRGGKEAEMLLKFGDVMESQNVYELKKGAPEGQILIKLNGQHYFLPRNQAEAAKAKGAKIL